MPGGRDDDLRPVAPDASPTTVPASAASPPRRASARWPGRSPGHSPGSPGLPVTLTCAGRTDAGVHALDQVVHFDLPAERSAGLDPAALVKSCNSQLGPAVVVRDGRVAPAGLRRPPLGHRPSLPVPGGQRPGGRPAARRPDLARGRPARPAIDGRGRRRPARRARLPGLLPAGAGNLAGRSHPPSGDRRPVDPAERRPAPDRGRRRRRSAAAPAPERCPALVPAVGILLAFEIEANAFCHQMVRSLVGTLVDVGRGRRRPSGHARDPPLGRPPAGLPAGSTPGPHPDGRPLRWVTRLARQGPFRSYRGRSPGRTASRDVRRYGDLHPFCRAPGSRVRWPAAHLRRCPDARHHRTRNPRAHVLTQARRHHPRLAHRRRRRPGARSPGHRGGLDPARQAQAHLRPQRRRRRPRDRGQRRQGGAHLGQGASTKMAYRHSGYPGGLTATSYSRPDDRPLRRGGAQRDLRDAARRPGWDGRWPPN